MANSYNENDIFECSTCGEQCPLYACLDENNEACAGDENREPTGFMCPSCGDIRMFFARRDFLTESSVCSICGFVYEICQKPPKDQLDELDNRKDPAKLELIRLGVNGEHMSEAQAESYDIHYPKK